MCVREVATVLPSRLQSGVLKAVSEIAKLIRSSYSLVLLLQLCSLGGLRTGSPLAGCCVPSSHRSFRAPFPICQKSENDAYFVGSVQEFKRLTSVEALDVVKCPVNVHPFPVSVPPHRPHPHPRVTSTHCALGSACALRKITA